MMRKYFSASRNSIDDTNESISRSWIVFRHGIVANLTFAAEFSAAEDLGISIQELSSFSLSNVLVIVQLLLSKELLFSFYFRNVHFHLSSFYYAKYYFINPGSS